MKPMSPKRFAWWEKARLKGKWRVICELSSVWTLALSVVWGLLGYITPARPFFSLITVMFLFGGGLLVGLSAWKNNERRYQKTLDTIPHDTYQINS